MDAYLEFLNENAHRAYPFVEDGNFLDDQSRTLANGVVLDLRIATKQKIVSTPRLRAIIADDGNTISSFSTVAENWNLFIEVGSTLLLVLVPFTNTVWPFRTEAFILSNFDSGHPVKESVIDITFGESLVSIPPGQISLFSLPIEPGCFFSLYKNVLDFVHVVHAESSEDIVGGDLIFTGGYNMGLIQDDAGINFQPAPGAGLGFTPLIQTTQDHCAGSIVAINGINPTERGEFFIYAGQGISVIPLPEEHKIRIIVANNSLPKGCA